MVTSVCVQAEDLRLLMQKMENWAHRLFPKLQFEQFIDKVERLGTKKDVQVWTVSSVLLLLSARISFLSLCRRV